MQRVLSGLIVLVPAVAPAAESSSFSPATAALQTLWALLVVVGLILVLYALARKRLAFGQPGGNAITVIAMRPLLPKTTLVLVEVRGREFLLGVSSGNLQLLADLSATKTGVQPDFSSLLAETEPP